jgi:hypothetical protein
VAEAGAGEGAKKRGGVGRLKKEGEDEVERLTAGGLLSGEPMLPPSLLALDNVEAGLEEVRLLRFSTRMRRSKCGLLGSGGEEEPSVWSSSGFSSDFSAAGDWLTRL